MEKSKNQPRTSTYPEPARVKRASGLAVVGRAFFEYLRESADPCVKLHNACNELGIHNRRGHEMKSILIAAGFVRTTGVNTIMRTEFMERFTAAKSIRILNAEIEQLTQEIAAEEKQARKLEGYKEDLYMGKLFPQLGYVTDKEISLLEELADKTMMAVPTMRGAVYDYESAGRERAGRIDRQIVSVTFGTDVVNVMVLGNGGNAAMDGIPEDDMDFFMFPERSEEDKEDIEIGRFVEELPCVLSNIPVDPLSPSFAGDQSDNVHNEEILRTSTLENPKD